MDNESESTLKMDQDEQMHDESPGNSGRKRSREGSPTSPSVTNLSLDDKNSMPSIKSLSLEAIFHPKFENENRNDQSIRSQMKERVFSGKGYIEVSLKHSGSLLLWSGGQRYYSKNSTENQFTYVGEVLLRQHFYRAFHDEPPTTALEANYQECSDYVQENRLTLSFEVITAILGHHGDIPKRDFLILTAVANRSAERFYSTSELVQFAQRFRLPHNDTWVFDSESGVEGVFHLYDTTRETGLAEDTIAALNRIADMHVSSMYPHVVFQGNILEGIVIRYVPYHDKKKEQDIMRDLAAEAQRVLKLVPPETPPSFVLTKELPGDKNAPSVLSTDIRTISRDVMATGDREKISAFLETTFRAILCSSDGSSRRSVDRKPLQVNKEWTSSFPSTLRKVLANQDLDEESTRILKLIETLDSLKSRVDYRIVKEATDGQPDRWLCIVHVFYDTTHQKFRQKMDPNDMALFRGFCIELGSDRREENMKLDNASGETLLPVDNESSGLMLKMKFLPYMVRTFGCRNGLQVISQRGPQAFTEYTSKLMTRWGMSVEAKAKWQPFFCAWGNYAHMCLTDEAHKYSNPSLPKLCDAFYLDHLEYFTKLFESGEIVGDVEKESSPTSTFRGLIFVVGLDHEKAAFAADMISERLGGLVVRKGLDSMTAEDWDAACLSRRVGMICSATVQDGVKRVRKQTQDCGEAMFAILVGCDEAAVLSECAIDDKSVSQEEGTASMVSTRKLHGLITSWKTTRFAKLCEVSHLDFFGGSGDSDAIQKLLKELNGASDSLPKVDDRPGLLVFFPSIPGSGKSTLCSKDTDEELRHMIRQTDEIEMKGDDNANSIPPRPVIIRVGDEVKNKYWPLVKVEKTKNRSSVYLADKNTPPAAWPGVAKVCSMTNGVAVPVIPDGAALQTASIKGAGHFPFSLHYLAVCMARVMARPAESHSGNLDRSTDLACMVVVKFFSLYRNIAANELLLSIEGAMLKGGAAISSSPITVPFLAQENLPELPSELENALSDALRIQVSSFTHEVASALLHSYSWTHSVPVSSTNMMLCLMRSPHERMNKSKKSRRGCEN